MGQSPIERHLPDEAATARLGEDIAAALRPGDVVALSGDLGAGKTTLARGVARGLGVDDPDAVQSPTYLLVVEHPGPVPMLHLDAYLPEKTRAFLIDGGLDYLADVAGVTVVEWAERLADLLPRERLTVELAPDGRGGRQARLSGPPAFRWIETVPQFADGR